MGIHMSSFFLRDEGLDDLVKGKDIYEDPEGELPDSSVTVTYGGDGVMLPEVFDSGAALMVQAAGRKVWLAWDDDRDIMFFFIGELEEVKKKIERCPDLVDEERLADEAGEGGG